MTVERYALIEGENVVNVILWDSEEEFEVAEGLVAKLAPEEVGPGWQFSNDWVPPVASPEPEMPVIVEDPVVTEAKFEALRQLTALGITEPVARTIVGLPPE
ncbi:hypothetical protein PBI_LORETTA_24 [Arthrobacter phage Loretta]|nr:hypothetical protein PBI_LORETTA_24 [Arthrobacter phage Loretta]